MDPAGALSGLMSRFPPPGSHFPSGICSLHLISALFVVSRCPGWHWGSGQALLWLPAVLSHPEPGRVPSLPFPSPWKPGSPAGSVPGPRRLDEHGTHGAGASPGAGPGAAEEGGRAGPVSVAGVTRGRCLWCRCGTRRSGSLWMNGSPGEIPEGRRNF